MIIIPIKILTKNHRYNLNRVLFHSSVRMSINASAFEYPDFDLRMTDGLSDLAVGIMPAISAGNRE